jgi:uncharacterized protein
MSLDVDRFHEGERAVQRRVGVEEVADRVGSMIQSFVPAEFAEFLGRQPFVVVASQDRQDRVWASLIAGGVGFARAMSDHQVVLEAAPAPGDPLEEALDRPNAQIGVLAIKFGTRQRIRVNGTGQRTDGILLTVTEAYGNCAKYIQRRIPAGRHAGPAGRHAEPVGPHPELAGQHAELAGPAHRTSAALDARQVAIVRRADTAFIASTHPERGADASHRGGRPGFIEVTDDGRLVTIPDYIGNRLFQTLGNLTVVPQVGLLLLDWETGSALQVTGKARIIWDAQAVRSRPGAERLIEIAVDGVHEHDRAMPVRWTLIEPYQRNPPVNPRAAAPG